MKNKPQQNMKAVQSGVSYWLFSTEADSVGRILFDCDVQETVEVIMVALIAPLVLFIVICWVGPT